VIVDVLVNVIVFGFFGCGYAALCSMWQLLVFAARFLPMTDDR
jgi:hypothetical protein